MQVAGVKVTNTFDVDAFPEEEQTFCHFATEGRQTKPTWEKDTIFLMPLGNFSSDKDKVSTTSSPT
jgi:hypothetical protein